MNKVDENMRALSSFKTENLTDEEKKRLQDLDKELKHIKGIELWNIENHLGECLRMTIYTEECLQQFGYRLELLEFDFMDWQEQGPSLKGLSTHQENISLE